MPSQVINGLTAPDNYTVASTIMGGRIIDHLNVDVSNQPILWQVFESPGDPYRGGSGDWGNEVLMLPGSRVLDRSGIAGFRFRAAVKAASLPAGKLQAVVTVEAVEM